MTKGFDRVVFRQTYNLEAGSYIDMCWQDMMDEKKLANQAKRNEEYRKKWGRKVGKWENAFGR